MLFFQKTHSSWANNIKLHLNNYFPEIILVSRTNNLYSIYPLFNLQSHYTSPSTLCPKLINYLDYNNIFPLPSTYTWPNQTVQYQAACICFRIVQRIMLSDETRFLRASTSFHRRIDTDSYDGWQHWSTIVIIQNARVN